MSIFPPGYITVEDKQQQKKAKTTTKAYNQNYFDSRQLVWRAEDKKENIEGVQEEATFIMCGFFQTDHYIMGKSYWTHDPAIHKKFPWQKGAPANWRDEIALNYTAKNQRLNMETTIQKKIWIIRKISFLLLLIFLAVLPLLRNPSIS